VHVAAYRNNTLGNPLLCPKERLQFINRDVIEAYRSTFYKPERMVVAFAGVAHEEAIHLTEQYFGDMVKGEAPGLPSPSDTASEEALSQPTSKSSRCAHYSCRYANLLQALHPTLVLLLHTKRTSSRNFPSSRTSPLLHLEPPLYSLRHYRSSPQILLYPPNIQEALCPSPPLLL
jgi:hypothetical protein